MLEFFLLFPHPLRNPTHPGTGVAVDGYEFLTLVPCYGEIEAVNYFFLLIECGSLVGCRYGCSRYSQRILTEGSRFYAAQDLWIPIYFRVLHELTAPLRAL